MSSTQEWRKCYICGEPVLWQTNGIGWHPIQYHDCKPVPLARLEQAERERDEARNALALERQHRDGHLPSCAGINHEEGRCECGYLEGAAYRDLTERLAQAVALLGMVDAEPSTAWAGARNRLLAGQPAPVYEAMARVCEAARDMRYLYAYDISEAMRDALSELERARKGEG